LLLTNPDATVVVTPSDHLITGEAEFVSTVKNAIDFAQQGDHLITIGIKPTRPETGYGYIQVSEGAGSCTALGICKVKTFTEKPNAEMAQAFVSSGEFYWNAGMFIWTLSSIRKAIETHLPETGRLFAAGFDKYNTPEEAKFVEDTYAECKAISIDYGIIEKADNVYVIGADFGWCDLGSWTSLYLQHTPDADGNVACASGTVLQDVKDTMIKTASGKLVVLQGLDGYLVVDTPDILLVCKRGDDNLIKQITGNAILQKGDSIA
jgi:mannose-1-phosphate guanylyltransferase